MFPDNKVLGFAHLKVCNYLCDRGLCFLVVYFRVLYDRICTVTQIAISMNNPLIAQCPATKIAQ